MNSLFLLAAAIDPLARDANPVRLSRDVLLVMLASLALAFVLFLWAFFLRRRHRRSHSPWDEVIANSSGRKRRKRRRRSRRMNPTLADTGGLPKRRDESDATD